jgi:dynactin complex subunit
MIKTRKRESIKMTKCEECGKKDEIIDDLYSKIDCLKGKIDHLNGEIEDLEAENESLQSELDDIDDR